MLLSGAVREDILERMAAAHPDFRRDKISGVPILGGGRVWLAHRGGTGPAGELVLATTRELLAKTLTESAGHYDLDRNAPFAFVVGEQKIKAAVVARRAGEAASPLEAVRQARIVLERGNSVLTGRFVTTDHAAAQRLAVELNSALGDLLGRMKVRPENVPSTDVRVEDNDVIARVEFPPDRLAALASRIASTVGARSGVN